MNAHSSGELQRRLNTDPALSNISVLGIDPGAMITGISRRGPWLISFLLFHVIFPVLVRLQSWWYPDGDSYFRTTERSAVDVLAAALDSNPVLGEHPKGMYLYGCKQYGTSQESKDPRKREMLWRDSIGYAQLREGETILSNWR